MVVGPKLPQIRYIFKRVNLLPSHIFVDNGIQLEIFQDPSEAPQTARKLFKAAKFNGSHFLDYNYLYSRFKENSPAKATNRYKVYKAVRIKGVTVGFMP